jgi:hypothetical protein
LRLPRVTFTAASRGRRFLAASTELLIGDTDGSYVLIRPVSRRHPGLFDHRDANWIECDCLIAAAGFRGEVRADLRSDELQAFLDGVRVLQQSPGEVAALTPQEGRLALALQGDGRRGVRVNGEAVDDDNRLQFTFDIEAGALDAIGDALQRILAVFPVIAAPEA